MRALAALPLLCLPVMAHAAPANTPAQVVREFYAWEIADGQYDPRSLAPVDDLLAGPLKALLLATWRYEEACRRLAPPDEKPTSSTARPGTTTSPTAPARS